MYKSRSSCESEYYMSRPIILFLWFQQQSKVKKAAHCCCSRQKTRFPNCVAIETFQKSFRRNNKGYLSLMSWLVTIGQLVFKEANTWDENSHPPASQAKPKKQESGWSRFLEARSGKLIQCIARDDVLRQKLCLGYSHRISLIKVNFRPQLGGLWMLMCTTFIARKPVV